MTRPQLTYVTAALLFAADRICKSAALGGTVAGTDLVSFRLFMNSGIAFSIPLPDAVFWPFAVIVLSVLVVLFVSGARKRAITASFLAMIILGAVSNLIDRVTEGGTVDYLIFFGRSAVNIADGMILAGVLAILLRRHRKTEATSVAAADN